MSWAVDEFEGLCLGDKRLNTRLVKVCEAFSESPESPINQACADWAETKAAYRFFQNKNVDSGEIIKAHRKKTLARAADSDTILAIQDSSYFVYTNHPKTKGLGKITVKKGKNIDKIYSQGLVMHSCLAVTTTGAALGLLDQKIYARKLRADHQRRSTGGKPVHDTLPVEEKESYRWIEALECTTQEATEAKIVTVCDRECDFYDFFKVAQQSGATVLIRAAQNRTINRSSRYAEKDVTKLWDFIESQPSSGSYNVEVSGLAKSKHCKKRTARTAELEVKYGCFKMNPPRNNPKHKKEQLPDIQMYVIQAREKHPPKGEKALEWILLTNQPVTSFDQACEKVHWYSLRWRIEMFFKVLKSGFQVELCRLGTAERLIRYLTIMSVVAWRLFMLTLIGRTKPSLPCSEFLSDPEWTVLVATTSINGEPTTDPPTMQEALVRIAKLGGFLARKGGKFPGTLVLWRGWKRLMDLTRAWVMATRSLTCG